MVHSGQGQSLWIQAESLLVSYEWNMMSLWKWRQDEPWEMSGPHGAEGAEAGWVAFDPSMVEGHQVTSAWERVITACTWVSTPVPTLQEGRGTPRREATCSHPKARRCRMASWAQIHLIQGVKALPTPAVCWARVSLGRLTGIWWASPVRGWSGFKSQKLEPMLMFTFENLISCLWQNHKTSPAFKITNVSSLPSEISPSLRLGNCGSAHFLF